MDLRHPQISADLYDNGRDDLTLFYFKEGKLCISNNLSKLHQRIIWNQKSNKKSIKGLFNTKNANTLLVNRELKV